MRSRQHAALDKFSSDRERVKVRELNRGMDGHETCQSELILSSKWDTKININKKSFNMEFVSHFDDNMSSL